jgi:TolB-like protein/Flp pilus assembly protein TadD
MVIEPEPLRGRVSEVPEALERIISRALRKDREERYQTAQELLADLTGHKQELELEARLKSDRQLSAASGAGSPLGQIRRHWRVAALALITFAVVVSTLAVYFVRGGQSIDSILVLPLANTGGDPNAEYLSDGMTESLINQLTQLRNLRVMARTTAFRYKDKAVDPQQVGRELGVRAVLTGRLQQRGDAVTMQFDLINVDNGAQLWGEQYQRRLAELPLIQQEMAREVVGRLKLSLSGGERAQLAKHETSNSEAYQAYLKGRFYWNKRTENGIKKAIEYFQQATESDPNYARAYAGLADSYGLLPQYSATPAHEAMPQAKRAVQKALELDDRLAEAHASLASILELYDWDFAGAEREFRRAIELDPNYPTAHQWYAALLGEVFGRFDEAIAEAKRGQQLDPLSLIINKAVARQLATARRYEEAIEQFNKTLEMDPNFNSARWELAGAYAGRRMYAEALATYQEAINRAGRELDYLANLGHDYALAGREDEARKLLGELRERAKREHVSAAYFAMVYSGLGEKDQAFAWLDQAYAAHDYNLAYLKTDRRFDNLRSDPRFAELLRRMGLQP